ncbi:MAG: hypothetical protein ACNA7Q_14875, partial [Rhodobacterales bacterium]
RDATVGAYTAAALSPSRGVAMTGQREAVYPRHIIRLIRLPHLSQNRRPILLTAGVSATARRRYAP